MSNTETFKLLGSTLPAALTIDTVEALAADFCMQSLDGTALTLDASHVETITTPGVQLILSLAKSLEAKGGVLRIAHARPTVAQVFEKLGLATQFSMWGDVA